MTVFKVAYIPEISKEAEQIIRKEVSYSMISQDGDSCQYDIERCISTLNYYELTDDVEVLWACVIDDVSYIEF